MNWFNRLPGFVPSPPGIERRILRRVPSALLWGSLLLALPLLLVRLGTFDGAIVMHTDIAVIALLILWWTVVPTVALAAFIVMAMKGPAYVADPYPLVEYDAFSDGKSR
jgi:hypothetical protein